MLHFNVEPDDPRKDPDLGIKPPPVIDCPHCSSPFWRRKVRKADGAEHLFCAMCGIRKGDNPNGERTPDSYPEAP